MDNIPWATPPIKSSFKGLPLLGEDIFRGKYDSHLQAQATKAKAVKDTDTCFTKLRQQGRTSSNRPCKLSGYSGYKSYGESDGKSNRYQPYDALPVTSMEAPARTTARTTVGTTAAGAAPT